jgi:hypothetical protein
LQHVTFSTHSLTVSAKSTFGRSHTRPVEQFFLQIAHHYFIAADFISTYPDRLVKGGRVWCGLISVGLRRR